jgi:hypothetical protein
VRIQISNWKNLYLVYYCICTNTLAVLKNGREGEVTDFEYRTFANEGS